MTSKKKNYVLYVLAIIFIGGSLGAIFDGVWNVWFWAFNIPLIVLCQWWFLERKVPDKTELINLETLESTDGICDKTFCKAARSGNTDWCEDHQLKL